MTMRDFIKENKEETTYTPGPWIATGWEDLVVNLPNGDTIASAPGPGGAPLAVLQANARLIAAAPDLVEALRFFADPENWREQETGIGMFPSDAERKGCALARAALEKAGVPL